MDFEERARKAHRRGQLVRAAVLLAEGLKRHPERLDALDFLTNLFANELESPGLEQDLVDAMAAQDDRRERIEFLLERYAERDKPTMGRELARAANERFGGFEWPPPTPEQTVEPADSAPVDADPGEPESNEPESDVEDTRSEPEGETDAPSDASAEVSEPAGDAPVEPDDIEDGDAEQEELLQEGLRAAQERLRADEVGASEPTEGASPDDIANAPTMEHARSEPSTDAQKPKESKDRGVGRRFLFVLLAAAIAGGAAFLGWTYTNSEGEEADTEVEERDLESLDTSDRSEMPESLGVVEDSNGEASQSEFIEAVYAVDWGEELTGEVAGDDKYSVAYRAVLHAQKGDFERGIASVTVLEQRFPDSLTTIWARAMLEEFRGNYVNAGDAYRQGAQKFTSFVPFYTGQIRVRTRQGRAGAEKELFEGLEEESPKHPYLAIQKAVWPTSKLLFDGERPESDSTPLAESEVEPRPRIVRAVAELHASLLHADASKRRAAARASVGLEPDFAPAQLYLGALEARELDISRAEAAFASAAAVDGISESFGWLVQAAAQQSLLGAGRPDRGLKFAVPVELKGADAEAASANQLPNSVIDPVVAGAQLTDGLPVRAMGFRAILLAELGLFSTADAALESARTAAGTAAETGFLDFVEVEMRIMEGKRNEAIRARRKMQDGPYRQLALAAVSYHDGDYAVAADAGEKALEAVGVRNLAARYTALSLAAGGQVRQALAQLDKWAVGPVWAAALRSIHMRVLSRVDPDAAEVQETYKAFMEAEPVGVHRRIDLASTDFWRKRYDAAAKHLEAARDAAQKHPEVNWLLSLVARSSESAGDVEAFLSDSWRGQSGDASLLLELGQIQLELERYPQARQLFYRALLADRTSIEAIRGMGRAYLGYDTARGRRDMAGFIENYGTDSRSLAPKSEVYRWLAVLHGVRKGDEKGYSYLEKAVELVGETPHLLVERARYHEANGKTAEARRAFARALERNSSFASAHLGLARTALESGDESVARTHLTRFLALRGSGEGTGWAREKLEELRRAPPEADEE